MSINGVNATEIQGIPVDATTPTANQGLFYNSVTGEWTPTNISDVLEGDNGITISNDGGLGKVTWGAAAGAGVSITAGNPPTIAGNYQAGTGISITGNPPVITNTSPATGLLPSIYQTLNNFEITGTGLIGLMNITNGVSLVTLYLRNSSGSTVSINASVTVTDETGTQTWTLNGINSSTAAVVPASALNLGGGRSFAAIPLTVRTVGTNTGFIGVQVGTANVIYASGQVVQLSTV